MLDMLEDGLNDNHLHALWYGVIKEPVTRWPGMLHSLHLFSPNWLLGGGARLSRSSAKYLSQGTFRFHNDVCVLPVPVPLIS